MIFNAFLTGLYPKTSKSSFGINVRSAVHLSATTCLTSEHRFALFCNQARNLKAPALLTRGTNCSMMPPKNGTFGYLLAFLAF
jgi:hypothetical protein